MCCLHWSAAAKFRYQKSEGASYERAKMLGFLSGAKTLWLSKSRSKHMCSHQQPYSPSRRIGLSKVCTKAMNNDIYLAWAIPVDPLHTLASLLAFASSKAALTTFRLCARSAQIPAPRLSRLPLEIILRIEDYVLSSCRTTELERLSVPFKCLTDVCDPEDHLNEEQIDEIRDRCVTSALLVLHVIYFIISATEMRIIQSSTCLRARNLTAIVTTIGSGSNVSSPSRETILILIPIYSRIFSTNILCMSKMNGRRSMWTTCIGCTLSSLYHVLS